MCVYDTQVGALVKKRATFLKSVADEKASPSSKVLYLYMHTYIYTH